MINKSKEMKRVYPECPGAYSEGVKGGLSNHGDMTAPETHRFR